MDEIDKYAYRPLPFEKYAYCLPLPQRRYYRADADAAATSCVSSSTSTSAWRKRTRTDIFSPYFSTSSIIKGKVAQKQKQKQKIVVSPYFNHNYGPQYEVQIAEKKNEVDAKGGGTARVNGRDRGKGNGKVVSLPFQNGSSEKGIRVNHDSGKGKGNNKDRGKVKVIVVSPYFEHPNYNNGNYKVVVQEKALKNPHFLVHQEGKPSSYSSPLTFAREGEGEGEDASNVRGSDRRRSRGQKVPFNPLLDAYRRKSIDNNWVPPRSTHMLLQEDYYEDPWKVLVICMLLNRTTGRQASQVISDLFNLCPDAEAATKVETVDIENVICSLGLHKKRSSMIQQFSQEYLSNEWTHVSQLHGVGKYASDAYAIFCTGRWMDVEPDDHKLLAYWETLQDSEVFGNSTSMTNI